MPCVGRGYETCEVLDLTTAILRSVNVPQKSTLGLHLKCTFLGLIHTCTRGDPQMLITEVFNKVIILIFNNTHSGSFHTF